MKSIEKSIEVNAPIRTVYNQWTQFEQFPLFMEGVKEVRQLDDTHLHWRANVGGKELEWDAEILEQIPDQSISWCSTSGKQNSGIVRFDKVDDATTRVSLALDLEAETVTEKVGSAIGIPGHRIEADLKRFKSFIEERGQETGAWRGEAHHGRVDDAATRH